jgi:hypothetical protein
LADEGIMKQLTPLKFENRLSTGTLFIHAEINDDGIVKTIHASYDTKTGKSGLEVYQGSNYVVGSTGRSYSRYYAGFRNIPPKYKALADKMRTHLMKHVRRK